jgi:hypothetical protein
MTNHRGLALIPTAEALELLALAESVLTLHFQGVALPIILDTRALVINGSATRQASNAIECSGFAKRVRSGVACRVFEFCSALLWDVEPGKT